MSVERCIINYYEREGILMITDLSLNATNGDKLLPHMICNLCGPTDEVRDWTEWQEIIKSHTLLFINN